MFIITPLYASIVDFNIVAALDFELVTASEMGNEWQ
jgi:hypothetical protein